ncbi:hypothetical protein Tco_0986568 [Tanacetum coccineum]
MWMEHTTLKMTTNDRPCLLSEISAVLDGGSFDNVRVNLGIDISRKAGEVPMAALNIKSEVDGAIKQDKSNTLTQLPQTFKTIARAIANLSAISLCTLAA